MTNHCIKFHKHLISSFYSNLDQILQDLSGSHRHVLIQRGRTWNPKRITKKTTDQIFMKFYGTVGHNSGTNRLHFDWYVVHLSNINSRHFFLHSVIIPQTDCVYWLFTTDFSLIDNVMYLCSWPHCNRRTISSSMMMMMVMVMMTYGQCRWRLKGQIVSTNNSVHRRWVGKK